MFDISPKESWSAEADMLRAVFEELRASGEVNPAPGFYDRVGSRIEEISRQSVWVPLIYSRFRWRFVTACLALALGTLSYVLAGQSANDPIFSSASPQEQRDAILTQIVTYRKPN